MISKKSLLSLVAGSVLLAGGAFAAGEPEYAGNFAEKNPATGAYAPLERVTPRQETRVRGFGFGGGYSQLVIPGEQSPVRFKAGQPIEFVVRVSSQDRDPLATVQFFQVQPDKGNRTMRMADVGGPFNSHADDVSQKYAVQFTATKMGTSFFKIVPVQPLQPGEYTLSTPEIRDGFCFGIDP